MEAANGTSMLSESWGDAMARFEEDSDLAAYNLNSSRSLRKAYADLAAGRFPGV
jgi:hypothetical protein